MLGVVCISLQLEARPYVRWMAQSCGMVLETAEFVRVLELVVDSGVGSLPLVLVVDLGVADAVVDADQRLVGQRTGTVDRRLTWAALCCC